jgi:hypothetical protein
MKTFEKSKNFSQLALMYESIASSEYKTIPRHSWEEDAPFRHLFNLTKRHWEEQTLIDADPGLNLYGRRQRHRALDTKLKAEIETWKQTHVETLKNRAHNLKLQLVPKSVAATDPTVAARHLMILQSIGNPDPIVAAQLYRNGNAETRAAMRSAPQRVNASGMAYTTLVSEALIAEVALDEAPEEVMQEATDYESLAGHYAALAGSVISGVEQGHPGNAVAEADPKGSEIVILD